MCLLCSLCFVGGNYHSDSSSVHVSFVCVSSSVQLCLCFSVLLFFVIQVCMFLSCMCVVLCCV